MPGVKSLALMLAVWAGAVDAACGQALAIGLDVSGSVDPQEYWLQREGLATALSSPAVSAVLLSKAVAPTDIAVFEWSGPAHQIIVQPWITISDAAALEKVTGQLRSQPRVTGDLTTAIGSAMQFGVALLEMRQTCWRRTLDISGDGPANTGPRPQDLPPARIPDDVIINALVVGDLARDDINELSSYFTAYVIRGTGAFVETALGFDDYADAMERKLLRELQALTLSEAPRIQPAQISRYSEFVRSNTALHGAANW